MSCVFLSLSSLALLVQVEGAAVLCSFTGLPGVGSDSSPPPAEPAPDKGFGGGFSRESRESESPSGSQQRPKGCPSYSSALPHSLTMVRFPGAVEGLHGQGSHTQMPQGLGESPTWVTWGVQRIY